MLKTMTHRNLKTISFIFLRKGNGELKRFKWCNPYFITITTKHFLIQLSPLFEVERCVYIQLYSLVLRSSGKLTEFIKQTFNGYGLQCETRF